MSHPKAYAPAHGYMYQILVLCPNDREYEHCDYAVNTADKKHLLENYCLAYGPGYSFKVITLPQKYWMLTAKTIAMEWHGGMWSALYSFGSNGTITDRQRLLQEIDDCIKTAEPKETRRLNLLREYCQNA